MLPQKFLRENTRELKRNSNFYKNVAEIRYSECLRRMFQVIYNFGKDSSKSLLRVRMRKIGGRKARTPLVRENVI